MASYDDWLSSEPDDSFGWRRDERPPSVICAECGVTIVAGGISDPAVQKVFCQTHGRARAAQLLDMYLRARCTDETETCLCSDCMKWRNNREGPEPVDSDMCGDSQAEARNECEAAQRLK